MLLGINLWYVIGCSILLWNRWHLNCVVGTSSETCTIKGPYVPVHESVYAKPGWESFPDHWCTLDGILLISWKAQLLLSSLLLWLGPVLQVNPIRNNAQNPGLWHSVRRCNGCCSTNCRKLFWSHSRLWATRNCWWNMVSILNVFITLSHSHVVKDSWLASRHGDTCWAWEATSSVGSASAYPYQITSRNAAQ